MISFCKQHFAVIFIFEKSTHFHLSPYKINNLPNSSHLKRLTNLSPRLPRYRLCLAQDYTEHFAGLPHFLFSSVFLWISTSKLFAELLSVARPYRPLNLVPILL